MAFLLQDLTTTMLVIGFALLAIEILVLGFSTFVLFFVGLAAVLTGGLFYFQVLPESALNAALSTAVLSGIAALALWRPMQNMQKQTDAHKAQSDLVGLEFELSHDVAPGSDGVYRYSGVNWQLRSPDNLTRGTRVRVVDLEVGIMHIKSVDMP